MLPPTSGVSVRQFAKLDGCSHTLVGKAVKDGRLPVSEAGLLDPSLAGSGWRKRNRGVETPPEVATRRRGQAGAALPPDPSDLDDEDFVAEVLAGRFRNVSDAERVKENALAAKNLLAARREAGDVVDIEVAEAVLFEAARSIRDAWMNWPVRVGPLIAAELGVAAEPVVEALTTHVQQQLQDLGEPDAIFAADQQD